MGGVCVCVCVCVRYTMGVVQYKAVRCVLLKLSLCVTILLLLIDILKYYAVDTHNARLPVIHDHWTVRYIAHVPRHAALHRASTRHRPRLGDP